jgi:hypothetical protein
LRNVCEWNVGFHVLSLMSFSKLHYLPTWSMILFVCHNIEHTLLDYVFPSDRTNRVWSWQNIDWLVFDLWKWCINRTNLDAIGGPVVSNMFLFFPPKISSYKDIREFCYRTECLLIHRYHL